MDDTRFIFNPIGLIHSCFKEKFGIPRQAGLVSEARAVLEILRPYDREEAFRGLTEFSHVWIIFVFHASIRETWKPTVRPPRLGGNQRIGVFATRSGFRPNPVGISPVELEGIETGRGKICLLLKGIDFLDGTPVLDVKPYLPYADSIPAAKGGYAHELPGPDLDVDFSGPADAVCREKEAAALPGFRRFLIQLLKSDPRPAYYSQKPLKHVFGTRVFDVDIRWEFQGNRILVSSIEQV
jgi:tRNA-Thr(GGU) m(6)t(6)A37 methyltransferase TsaA